MNLRKTLSYTKNKIKEDVRKDIMIVSVPIDRQIDSDFFEGLQKETKCILLAVMSCRSNHLQFSLIRGSKSLRTKTRVVSRRVRHLINA